MTRTERAAFPRALVKDRSASVPFIPQFIPLTSDRHISKNGLDNSLRKSGGGAHNWGSTLDQEDGDYADDVQYDAEASTNITVGDALPERTKDRRESVSTSSEQNDEDKEKAIAFRAKALKDGSRESSSNMHCHLDSNEWHALTCLFHHPFILYDVADMFPSLIVDLGSIARTSVAVSTSPK